MTAEADVADVLMEQEIISAPPRCSLHVAAKAGGVVALVALAAVALVLTAHSSVESFEPGALVNQERISMDDTAFKNVFGKPLNACSKPGTALTSFMRDGHCADPGDDATGAHHMCIQINENFCTVTKHPEWCTSEMQCMGQAGKCPIKNWCMCQWAFATYLEMAGGCDKIVELQCDATNLAAVKAYEKSSDHKHKKALACIRSKCGKWGKIK